jgi:hypothetical protein
MLKWFSIPAVLMAEVITIYLSVPNIHTVKRRQYRMQLLTCGVHVEVAEETALL